MQKKRRLWRALAALVCLGAVMFVALVGTVCYCAGMEREARELLSIRQTELYLRVIQF